VTPQSLATIAAAFATLASEKRNWEVGFRQTSATKKINNEAKYRHFVANFNTFPGYRHKHHRTATSLVLLQVHPASHHHRKPHLRFRVLFMFIFTS
jgi:hypothetical protein